MKHIPLLIFVLIVAIGGALTWKEYKNQRELFELARQIIEDEGYLLFQFATEGDAEHQMILDLKHINGTQVGSGEVLLNHNKAAIAVKIDHHKKKLGATIYSKASTVGISDFGFAEESIVSVTSHSSPVKVGEAFLIIKTAQHICELKVQPRQ